MQLYLVSFWWKKLVLIKYLLAYCARTICTEDYKKNATSIIIIVVTLVRIRKSVPVFQQSYIFTLVRIRKTDSVFEQSFSLGPENENASPVQCIYSISHFRPDTNNKAQPCIYAILHFVPYRYALFCLIFGAAWQRIVHAASCISCGRPKCRCDTRAANGRLQSEPASFVGCPSCIQMKMDCLFEWLKDIIIQQINNSTWQEYDILFAVFVKFASIEYEFLQ